MTTPIQEDLESKLPGLLEQHPDATEDFIRSVAEADPTGCRYVGWLIKTLQEGKWDLLEAGAMREVLTAFDACRAHPDWNGCEDLNDYTSLEQLVADIGQHPEQSKSPEEVTHGCKELASYNGYKVWQITTPEAAALFAFGKGGKESPSTQWPTRNTKIAAKYLVDGPLYVVTCNGQSVALIHFGRKDAKRADNLPLDVTLASEIAPVFAGQSFATELGTLSYRPGGWQLSDHDFKRCMKRIRFDFIQQRWNGFTKNGVFIEPIKNIKLLVHRWRAKKPEFEHALKQAQLHRDLDVIKRTGRRHPEPTGLQALVNSVYELEHA